MVSPLRTILVMFAVTLLWITPAHARPSLAAGSGFSLAVDASGFVYSWGNNTYGQLGDGTNTMRTSPVKVADLSDVSTVAAGANFAIALRTDGTVWSWGQNIFGQLGDETNASKMRPTQIKSLTGITAIAAGNEFAIALKNDNTIWVWGRNNVGQLGNGQTTNLNKPVQLSAPIHVLQIAVGAYHVLTLDSDGKVFAWGDNSYGQLGLGDKTARYTPTEVANIVLGSETNIQVSQIYAGYGQSYALKTNKIVAAWGLNTKGQLGYTSSNLPDFLLPHTLSITQDSSPISIETLSTASNQVFAKSTTGSYLVWGYNAQGQLGNNTTTDLNTPTTTTQLDSIALIAGGFDHCLGLTANGDVYSWGGNATNQLGNTTATSLSVPTKVKGIGGNGNLNLQTSITDTPDATPDLFTFTNAKDVGLQSEIRSNEITITGINAATSLSITGGEYSINAGAFTNNPVTVSQGDRIVVRHTSSAAYSQKTTTTLNIGGITATFESTTMPETTVADGSGGGGCTVLKGQNDISLLMLSMLAVLTIVRRSIKAKQHVY